MNILFVHRKKIIGEPQIHTVIRVNFNKHWNGVIHFFVIMIIIIIIIMTINYYNNNYYYYYYTFKINNNGLI